MKPGRRVWWAALLLMLFLPSSAWKQSGSSGHDVRVTVHEVSPALASDLMPAPRQAAARKIVRKTRKTRMPGLSQTD